MSKTSNIQKIEVLKVWLNELKRKAKTKKKNSEWLKENIDED